MLASAGAAPVLAAGGFAAVGVASVAFCLLTSLVAMQFPENRIRATQDDVESGWAATLLVGMSEARRSRRVRSAVILVAAVASVWGALDEYTPLLAASTGASDTGVALLMVVIWAGAASGGLLAGRADSLRPRMLAALICCGAVLLIVGALSDNPAGMIAIAAALRHLPARNGGRRHAAAAQHRRSGPGESLVCVRAFHIGTSAGPSWCNT